MEITRETVEHYAKLASLEFEPAEADAMARDLGTILDYVNKISELDLSDVEATCQVLGELQPVREDACAPSLGSESALANAPDRESDHFLVPKVISR